MAQPPMAPPPNRPLRPADAVLPRTAEAPPAPAPRPRPETGATPSGAAPAATQVIKRLAPDQPGARKLARHYGENLLCVRYRRSSDGRMRYTTIELIVEQWPVAAPARTRARDLATTTAAAVRADPLDEIVMVRIEFDDARRRRAALTLGAVWDHERHRWLMPRRAARALQLSESVS